MSARAIVAVHVRQQHMAQMTFAEHNDIALSASLDPR
jgi:hypothetical protein